MLGRGGDEKGMAGEEAADKSGGGDDA